MQMSQQIETVQSCTAVAKASLRAGQVHTP